MYNNNHKILCENIKTIREKMDFRTKKWQKYWIFPY